MNIPSLFLSGKEYQALYSVVSIRKLEHSLAYFVRKLDLRPPYLYHLSFTDFGFKNE